MRQYIIVAALAAGLIGIQAAIVPLSANSARKQAAAPSAVSRALFLCRSRSKSDQADMGALAKILVLDTKFDAPAQISNRRCHGGPQALANFGRLD